MVYSPLTIIYIYNHIYIYLHLISSVIFGPRFFDARPAVLAEEFLDIGGAPLNPKSLGKRKPARNGGFMVVEWRSHGEIMVF